MGSVGAMAMASVSCPSQGALGDASSSPILIYPEPIVSWVKIACLLLFTYLFEQSLMYPRQASTSLGSQDWP